MDYVTLQTVRAYLKLSATETADDALLQTFICWSTDTLDDIRRGDLRYETRVVDYPHAAPDAYGYYDAQSFVDQMNLTGQLATGALPLDDDLLELATVTNGDGETVPTTELLLEPANVYPKAALRIKRGSSYRWQLSANGEARQVISVTGWWGFHPRYAEALTAVDSVQDAPLASSATTITVTGAAAFEAGQLLRIEDELVTVTATDTDANTLSVARAVNGTSASEHASATLIYRYTPYGNYELAATRLVVWRYRQKDANVFDETTSFETGTTIIPSSIPADIRSLLPPRRMVRL